MEFEYTFIRQFAHAVARRMPLYKCSICMTSLQGHMKSFKKNIFSLLHFVFEVTRYTFCEYPGTFQPLSLSSVLSYDKKCFVWPCNELP